MLLSVAGVLAVITAVISTNVIWALNAPIPAFGQLQNRHIGESTKLYDRTGKVLIYDTAGSMRRITAPLSDISPYLISATIAIEDASFYNHDGVRPNAILRALLTNLATLSLNQGGSTITQQVVKNTLLTGNKNIIRKIKEWILALRIERHFTKNEILETYFNEIPYGSTMYGAEEASRAYFNKRASDLTLSEAAYLAALPKAPTYLSPWGSNLVALTNQHNLVLDKMLEHDLISKEEYRNALEEKVAFKGKNIESIKAPHFVFYVLEKLKIKYGRDVSLEGLQVITTLDWELQQESEKIIRDGALKNAKNYGASNASLVAIDPKTGQILAMVGSRNYFDDSVDGQVNVALSPRQPGSAFKPLVYATAFKKGYTPETVIFDLKTQFSSTCSPYDFSNVYPCYSPSNFGDKEKGPVTMREALAQSLNIPGVKTLYLAGINDSIETARRVGITTLTNAKQYGLSLVLGGGAVKLLEMTSAYGAFANDGEWLASTPIMSIATAKGHIIESYEGTPVQAIEKQVARTINDILSDNVARSPTFGSRSPMYFPDTLVASKTGTSQDYRDLWIIGYTPDIVVGAWAGNNDNKPTAKLAAAIIVAPMWHKAMQKALDKFTFTTTFLPPEKSIATLPLRLSGDWNTSSSTAGVHEILYWENKNDPQLALWDYPVSLWVQERASSTIATSTPLYAIGVN